MRAEFFESKILENIHHNMDIFELKIHSPLLAKNYKAGQFFKLQNFHHGYQQSFEPIAITASDVKDGIISSIIQIVGASTKAASNMKKGEIVALMGPCGMASELANKNSSFLLIGGGIGVYALLPYAKALRRNENKVTILCGYRKKSHAIYIDEILKAADQAFFICDEEYQLSFADEQNFIHGSIIDGLKKLDLSDFQNIFIVGSSSMMLAVAEFLESYTTREINKVASINAPMQCMFGGVCGQCLTLVPGKNDDKLVFICKNQDQKLDSKLMKNLETRLSQNSLLEKI